MSIRVSLFTFEMPKNDKSSTLLLIRVEGYSTPMESE